MEKVQKREGLTCICAECHKVIRCVGTVSADAAPLVSHGICPECAEKLYGDILRKSPQEKGGGSRPRGAEGEG
jgi:hypothetical protein